MYVNREPGIFSCDICGIEVEHDERVTLTRMLVCRYGIGLGESEQCSSREYDVCTDCEDLPMSVIFDRFEKHVAEDEPAYRMEPRPRKYAWMTGTNRERRTLS